MRVFVFLLRVSAIGFAAAGSLHLALGAGADVLLGAVLSEATLSDPVLDSQNRFYGVAFTVYAALFWLGAEDIQRYGPVLRAAFAVFFMAGLARVVSIVTHGLPSSLVIVLLAVEILLPFVLWLWLSVLDKRGHASGIETTRE